MLIRLNKFIADSGYCSRRTADLLIQSGKVTVNDKIVSSMGDKVCPLKDIVKVDGKILSITSKKVYFMLNKPEGYITTNKDEKNRKSTIDLIHENIRVFPIGRLDKDTEGLLLFTNDGQFANYMMHPKHHVEKTYIVTTDSAITNDKILKLKSGVDIGGYITKEAKVRLYSKDKLEIIISEGKNRQVRKMCESVGINVKKLKRVKIGNLELGNLRKGEYRSLTELELKKIKKYLKLID